MNKLEHKIGFIGLGYAGFPMACLFAKKFPLKGYDLSLRRISELNSGVDHCGDVPGEEIKEMLDNGAILTTDIEDLRDCNFYVVVVPTPVDKNLKPDMTFIDNASREVGSVLKKGDIVVFESTVFPGATEEICVPALEEVSGLKCDEDFFVGYSPERINPGDKIHTPHNTVKVTSGSTPEAAEIINGVYSAVLGRENTHPASSIKVAEACKVVENAQRDINIAFINEVAQVLNAFDIDTNEVVDAMNTKWNALGFRPGLVGGHCIGVDPYYLIERAKDKGVNTKLMSTARRINNSMAEYIATNVGKKLSEDGFGDNNKARVLLLGFTFKENCPDVRNTKVVDIYRNLKQFTPDITVYDPWADGELVQDIYGIKVDSRPTQIATKEFDAIVLCVAHDEFKGFNYAKYLTPGGFVFDVKGFVPCEQADKFDLKRI